MYELKVNLNGDAVEALTYRLTFDPRDTAGQQRYVLRHVAEASATDPHADLHGCRAVDDRRKDDNPECLRVWAGPAGDPLWCEPDVLHAVGHALQDGTTLNLGEWTPTHAKNFFAGTRFIRWCWKCPTKTCSPTEKVIASGPYIFIN
jgi:hypothetical protein